MSVLENLQGFQPNLDDSDYFEMLMTDMDFRAIHSAIHDMVVRNKNAERATMADIEDIEAQAAKQTISDDPNAWDLGQVHADRCYDAAYEDAANSMAAISMYAPFYETIFRRAFHSMHRDYFRDQIPGGNHLRVTHFTRNGQLRRDLFWECQKVAGPGGTVVGIMQLAEVTGLSQFLPPDLERKMFAMFEYRNAMFHNAWEWPAAERRTFCEKFSPQELELFFGQKNNGEDASIIYMSEAFIDDLRRTLMDFTNSIGKFVREVLIPMRDGASGSTPTPLGASNSQSP